MLVAPFGRFGVGGTKSTRVTYKMSPESTAHAQGWKEDFTMDEHAATMECIPSACYA